VQFCQQDSPVTRPDVHSSTEDDMAARVWTG
jgi:hypothetical protein